MNLKKILLGVAMALGTAYLLDVVRRLKPAMRWWKLAAEIGARYGLAPHLLVAVIAKESAGDPEALGDRGTAIGLMQVRPIAWKDVQLAFPQFAGVDHAALAGDPQLQIHAGAAYLALMFRRTVDFLDALDAYNQGERSAESSPGVSEYAWWVSAAALIAWLWGSFQVPRSG